LNQSKLRILGTSNVTDFECIYEDGFESDTLTHSVSFGEDLNLVSGDTLHLMIDSFDCGRRGINKDFRKALNSDEFPTIDISILNFENNTDLLEALNVLISIAGVQKEYTLTFNSSRKDQNIVKVEGERKLSMTDFNINPPKALFGLIKVQDDLTISFTISIKTL